MKRARCYEARFQTGKSAAEKKNKVLDFACAKQVSAINQVLVCLQDGTGPSLCSNKFKEKKVNTVCVIGDGYGYLGVLLKMVDPPLKIVFVNLGRTLFFDVLYTAGAMPEEKVVVALVCSCFSGSGIILIA